MFLSFISEMIKDQYPNERSDVDAKGSGGKGILMCILMFSHYSDYASRIYFANSISTHLIFI